MASQFTASKHPTKCQENANDRILVAMSTDMSLKRRMTKMMSVEAVVIHLFSEKVHRVLATRACVKYATGTIWLSNVSPHGKSITAAACLRLRDRKWRAWSARGVRHVTGCQRCMESQCWRSPRCSLKEKSVQLKVSHLGRV